MTSKSVYDMNQDAFDKYKTRENRFADFPVGEKVKIICACQDFNFFDSETGTVIDNSGKYLGIIVKFDTPRRFKGGHIQKDFNFAPQDLVQLNKTKKGNKMEFKCPWCKHAQAPREIENEISSISDDNESDTLIEMWLCDVCNKYFRTYYTLFDIKKFGEIE